LTLEGSEVRGIAPRDNVTVSLGARTLECRFWDSRNQRPEACYVIYNRAALSDPISRFISYNVKQTQWKILSAGLPRFLAQRLALGR
jgi:hypothetical protein